MVDDEGYSACSEDSDSDSTCSGDSDNDMGRSVVRRQSTLTMHWAQQAFQDTQEPVPGRGELFQMQGQSAVWSCDNRLVFERAFFGNPDCFSGNSFSAPVISNIVVLLIQGGFR